MGCAHGCCGGCGCSDGGWFRITPCCHCSLCRARGDRVSSTLRRLAHRGIRPGSCKPGGRTSSSSTSCNVTCLTRRPGNTMRPGWVVQVSTTLASSSIPEGMYVWTVTRSPGDMTGTRYECASLPNRDSPRAIVASHRSPYTRKSCAGPSPVLVTATHTGCPGVDVRPVLPESNSISVTRTGRGRSRHLMNRVVPADTSAAVGTICHHNARSMNRNLAVAAGEGVAR